MDERVLRHKFLHMIERSGLHFKHFWILAHSSKPHSWLFVPPNQENQISGTRRSSGWVLTYVKTFRMTFEKYFCFAIYSHTPFFTLYCIWKTKNQIFVTRSFSGGVSSEISYKNFYSMKNVFNSVCVCVFFYVCACSAVIGVLPLGILVVLVVPVSIATLVFLASRSSTEHRDHQRRRILGPLGP